MAIKQWIKRWFCLILTVALLSSCATMAGMDTPPQNSTERKILTQAVAGGAVVGGVVGGAIGKLADKKGWEGAAIGGVVGSVLGGLAGGQVGRNQIANLRDVELENQQLAELLESARRYNRQVAAFNQNLRGEIQTIQNRTLAEQKRVARQKREEVQKYYARVQAAIEERRTLSRTLVSDQQAKYRRTLAELEREEKRLEGAIASLRQIEERVKIG